MSDAGSENGDAIPKIGVYQGERNEQFERHGKGINQFPTGDMYEGMYNLGSRNGEGIYKWKTTNARYMGNYLGGKRHGTGTLVHPDGSKYVGDFEEGLKSGQGSYTYINGDVFQGEWKNDVKHGQGVYTYFGLEVKGNWVQGVLAGEASVIFLNSVVTGFFIDNDTVQGKVSVKVDELDSFVLLDQSPVQFGLKVAEAV